MNHYDDYGPQLKNESKVQSGFTRNTCSPSIAYVFELPALFEAWFQKPILISNQDCGTTVMSRVLSAIILSRVTNTQYLMTH